jgi:hypothetical protein
MLFGETVAVYCESHTENTRTLCGQNAEFWYVKAGGIYSNHWALKGRMVTAPASCSRVSSLKCRVGDRLFCDFPAFPQSLRESAGNAPQIRRPFDAVGLCSEVLRASLSK